MRELKFRIWDKDYCRFEYFEIGENDDCYGMFRIIANRFSSVVEQYTGLKDKNGKDIYEGDIVSVRNKNRKNEYDIGVVEFGKAAFRCPFLLGKYHSGQVEVIGNVHENSDLLEEK